MFSGKVSKGFTIIPLLIIAAIFLFIIGGGVALIIKIPIINIMFRFYMIIVIFSFVRRILGDGMASYAVTGVLAYIFVWRLWVLAAGVYITYIIMSFMLGGIIIFGLEGLWRRGGAGGASSAARRLG